MHHVELDQSGRTEKQNQESVLAFSNGIAASIRIPAKEKRLLYATLKERYHTLKNPDLKVFAAAVFLLISHDLRRLSGLTIDEEWTGHSREIRSTLLNYIRRVVPSFSADAITFANIGRRSRAHQLAYGVFKKRKTADRIITAADLLLLL
jgi:hypothetical protein